MASMVMGCGGDEPGPCTTFAGQCIGVPPAALCDEDFCTDGAACGRVIELEDGDDLAEAAAGAAPGTCIALAEGTYGGATLPAGVSVLGKSAHHVTVGPLTLKPGSGALVRGVRVEGGVSIDAATAVLEAVAVVGAPGVGVRVTGGADVTVVDSEIRGSGVHGALATDARALRLSRTIVLDSKGPGVWAQCASGCDCPERTTVTMSFVLFERNRHVGASLVGVQGELSTVAVRDTRQISEGQQTAGGGAMSISGCSDVVGTGITIDEAVSYGLLVDNSKATLGSSAESKGIIIVGTKVGMWLSNIQEGVTVENAEITDVEAVGIGIGSELASKGIIIVGTKVFRTASDALLVKPASQGQIKTVGHGFVWGDAAEVHVDGLTLGGNAMQSMLIDGPVAPGSTLKDVVLTDGDESKGIVQQLVMDADPAPATEGSTPALDRETQPVADVPAPPQAPAPVTVE